MRSRSRVAYDAGALPTSAIAIGLLGTLLAACAAGTSGSRAQQPEPTAEGSRAKKSETTDAAAAPERTSATPDARPAPSLTPEAASKAAGAFLGALEKGFPAARKLAKSSGQDAAEQASIVFYSLADAIESIPGASNRVPEQLTEMRFEAKRLHRSDRMTFSLAHWIKEGLTAALAALESQSRQSDPSAFWIAQARSSIAAIDAKSGLTFQRAVVQDAVRATVDAFVVLGQRMTDSR